MTVVGENSTNQTAYISVEDQLQPPCECSSNFPGARTTPTKEQNWVWIIPSAYKTAWELADGIVANDCYPHPFTATKKQNSHSMHRNFEVLEQPFFFLINGPIIYKSFEREHRETKILEDKCRFFFFTLKKKIQIIFLSCQLTTLKKKGIVRKFFEVKRSYRCERVSAEICVWALGWGGGEPILGVLAQT